MSESKPGPWFRVRFADGREVEIHGPDAIQIYNRDFQPVQAKAGNGTILLQSSDNSAIRPISSIADVFSGEMEKAKGTSDAILKILETSWGRKTLRTWDEIMAGLKVAGYQFSEGAITGALPELVKRGRLRRTKVGKSYGYGLPLSSK